MSDLIKQCDECRLNECINCEHSWADIQEIKKQLSGKDKEIEKLRDKLKRTEKAMLEEVNEHIEYYNADQKHLRKQVCEEIREKIEKRIEAYPIICEDEKGIVRRCVFLDNIKDILDQIEKGEEV